MLKRIKIINIILEIDEHGSPVRGFDLNKKEFIDDVSKYKYMNTKTSNKNIKKISANSVSYITLKQSKK